MIKIFNTIIVHFDEIGLKGKNQIFFVRKLQQDIEKRLITEVEIGAKKLIVSWPKDYSWPEIKEKLKFVPGIAFFAPAIIVKSKLKDIEEKAKELICFYQPKTFRCSARRADKDFVMDSMTLSRHLGEIILAENPKLNVSMKNAELEIRVEVDKDKTAILGKAERGIGGLPVGSTGEVLCLLSGGFDSPVAAYMMMKRGAHVNFIHFHNATINKGGVESKIKDLVKQLSHVQGKSKMFLVPFANLQREVIKQVPAEVRMIVYRRLMFKIAERVAKKNKFLALVTGDNLGQVASQTLENMNVIAAATSMLKLTPLAGFNKNEIINLAQIIGTHDISVRPYGDCCNLLVAKHPQTASKVNYIEGIEAECNFDILMNEAIETTKIEEI